MSKGNARQPVSANGLCGKYVAVLQFSKMLANSVYRNAIGRMYLLKLIQTDRGETLLCERKFFVNTISAFGNLRTSVRSIYFLKVCLQSRNV